MQSPRRPTRDILIETAARLFRRSGYHGVGLTEILATSGVPKGSLYHHFPNGKADLAIAAASWAATGMFQIIEDAFQHAESFEEGVKTLCYKLAKFFDISEQAMGCPVSSILSQADDIPEFRSATGQIFDGWIEHIARHGCRLGIAEKQARDQAELVLILIQGAWVMARLRDTSDPIRRVGDQFTR